MNVVDDDVLGLDPCDEPALDDTGVLPLCALYIKSEDNGGSLVGTTRADASLVCVLESVLSPSVLLETPFV